MQSASNLLTEALKSSHVLKSIPKVTFEWNQNRYAGILKVDNEPSDSLWGHDVENYPVDSITLPQRPTRGVVKARTSPPVYQTIAGPWKRHSVASGDEGFTAEDYTDSPNVVRYYTTGPGPGYKYWTSPAPTTTEQNGLGFSFPGGLEVQPYILYKTSARVNKVVVGLENSWATPTDYSIQITQDGGASWLTVGTNLVPNDKGQVIVYRQASGAWGQTKNLSNPTTINGVRLLVRGMNHADAFFNLIELSARLELDMSPYVIGYQTTLEMSDANFLTPLGRASSNMGSVTLSNLDGMFNNENPLSIFYRLIDKNILVTIDLEYDLTDLGGGMESIREATMYVDQWSGESDLEITAELKDSSKFLQEEKVPQTLLQNITTGEAVWRICDSIGFTNFIYDRKDADPVSTLEYYWTEEGDTVWDAFQALAEATQTAIFFDEFDVLRVKSREAAYDLSKSPVWALEATDAPGKLADIIDANITADYEANIVNINYQTTKISDDNRGFPEMQVLWTPEDSFVLRASRLSSQLTADAMIMRIVPGDVAVWPYKGLVNIEGELIRYEGKEYTYFANGGGLVTQWVTTHEDKLNIDKVLSDPDQFYKSTWTGRIKLTERGVYWTSPREHLVDIAGWTGRLSSRNNPNTNPWAGGISQGPSTLRVTSPATASVDGMYIVGRGNVSDAPFRRYGTRFKFSQNSTSGSAGIAIFVGEGESGYYFDVTPTDILNANGGAMRKFINEVGFMARHTNGSQHRLGGKGSAALIVRDKWYDLDVDIHINAAGAHEIVVYLNGIQHGKYYLTGGRVNPSGRIAAFVRGKATAHYEYIFAHAGGEEYRTDEVSQYDKVRKGFVSGQWDREYVFSSRSSKRKIGRNTQQYRQAYNQYLFDEFGPIVHEIREMDVPFEKYPVIHSRIYISNESQILCPEYNATPFGAKFMLANTSRTNAVANGEDTLMFGADNPVDQTMMIYGRLVFQEEAQVFTAKNDKGRDVNPFQNEDSIRRRGKVEIDIDSKWIQSKTEAEQLGNWILKHWSGGNDQVECEIFGNPLFQLGDVVTVDYPAKNLHRVTHKYFIVAINNEFSEGLSTSLVLRRAKS